MLNDSFFTAEFAENAEDGWFLFNKTMAAHGRQWVLKRHEIKAFAVPKRRAAWCEDCA